MSSVKAPVQAAPKKAAGDKKVAKKGNVAGKKAHKPGKQTLKGKSLGKVGGKKSTLKFSIDCAHPVEDGIMNCGDFETYLNERIKVGGKTNNMGKEVSLAREKNKIVLVRFFLNFLGKSFTSQE
jgi:hypothetical protein